ncbi:type II toxin-antitoxin system VapC family toxin [Haladaptatus sp. DFWS20]|uniref:type II toxin-antitoxin system VapC family toxin n=1 Tax=Haladaptatus sp. DFWS20 TaxID=3403467 RepID=UPI003EB909C9
MPPSTSTADAARSLFVDTGALFAVFNPNDERHDAARVVMQKIRTGEAPYRPLYISSFAVGELATLMLRKLGHDAAVEGIQRIRESPNLIILYPGPAAFANTCAEFSRYDDQQISFVDHMTGVLADERDATHVFAFDSDFRTLGLTVVPEDVGIL